MKKLILGDKFAKYPIIQGGMGVGISLHNLAGTVSKEGGIGVIATADIGFKEKDFAENSLQANLRAIKKEIGLARKIAGEDKILGVNIMVALKNYAQIVKECVKNKIDLIISGAGLPKNLPEFVKGSKTKIAPIVSSLRCCKLLVEHWHKKYNYLPDMIIIEGPKAGGHLGFKEEELKENPSLENITVDVVSYIKDVEEKYHQNIPVICAGGIYDRDDIQKYLSLGASGVQMATRFVATDECDADIKFKEAYVNAKEEDIKIIKSPVGMPGRALNNAFVKRIENNHEKITKCYSCLSTCDILKTPYCISKALINAAQGDIDNALVFCGANVYKVNKIVPVKELMKELTRGL